MRPIILCRACQSNNFVLLRESTLDSRLSIDNFSISDSNYGDTLSLYKCLDCNLIQAPIEDVTHFYKQLEDPDYEKEREQRHLQSVKIISLFKKELKNSTSQPSLLDIGAGSGIMVQAASDAGFNAEGIEPSTWLAGIASRKNLKVHTGILPHKDISKKYDVVTIIDVIEHVVDPFDLLLEAKKHLKHDGLLVIITPNVRSLAAICLKYNWWHYRVAHITYFEKSNLNILLSKIGLNVITYKHPGWYFSYPYLRERLRKYLPNFILPASNGYLKKAVISVNPLDSIMAICRHK